MKSSFRTFALAAIAAASFAASTHTASAQAYSRNASADYQLEASGYVTVNALILARPERLPLAVSKRSSIKAPSPSMYIAGCRPWPAVTRCCPTGRSPR